MKYFPYQVTIDGVIYEGSARKKVDARRAAAQKAVDGILDLQPPIQPHVEAPGPAIPAAVVQTPEDDEFANLIRT